MLSVVTQKIMPPSKKIKVALTCNFADETLVCDHLNEHYQKKSSTFMW